MLLRDYQSDICSRVSDAFDKHRSVMVQMPTGTGKTMVLAELVKQLMMKDEGIRILIVAHRRELIEQIKATVKRMGLNADNQLSVINNQTPYSLILHHQSLHQFGQHHGFARTCGHLHHDTTTLIKSIAYS